MLSELSLIDKIEEIEEISDELSDSDNDGGLAMPSCNEMR